MRKCSGILWTDILAYNIASRDRDNNMLQNKLFDLIKCSHGFKAIVIAMFMTLIIFISAIREKKLMYLWLGVTHSCNLPIYGKLEINENYTQNSLSYWLHKFCSNTLSAPALLSKKENYQG